MIVIADDITGAAEMAGIAWAKGYNARLVCGCNIAIDATGAAVFIATDTRSMSESEAVAEIRRLIPELRSPAPALLACYQRDARTRSLSLITSCLFKKTDSALRGHVMAELSTLMETMGYERAVYMPANPSKGRVIREGVYYIDGKPLHETDFSFDPEYPAKTSVLKERFPDAEAHHILMPDAETVEDVKRIVADYDDGRTLFAGAADLFRSSFARLLPKGRKNALMHRQASTPSYSFQLLPTPSSSLILCGSTQSKPLAIGLPTAPMPREIYDGSDDLSLWDVGAYEKEHGLILTIPYTHRTGKAAAVHLRKMMAAMAKRLVGEHHPDHLVVEGGATAWATFEALGWDSFQIEREFAPGVVQMRASNGTLVTLKPGSYPW